MSKGWASTMKEYFGFRKGDNAGAFMTELKALNNEERQEFHRMLIVAGYECDAPLPLGVKA